MILTTDVAYAGSTAVAAGVLHRDWTSSQAERIVVRPVDGVAPYEPGAFYRRELPCLLALLQDIEPALSAIVIDGYVSLGPDGTPGLGWHLHNAIDGSPPIVGIAKSEYAGTPDSCRLLRGKSRRPLFVTAIGMPLDHARTLVARMHGGSRIPTVLQMADRACRAYLADNPDGPG